MNFVALFESESMSQSSCFATNRFLRLKQKHLRGSDENFYQNFLSLSIKTGLNLIKS
jgi:hypothetical protein